MLFVRCIKINVVFYLGGVEGDRDQDVGKEEVEDTEESQVGGVHGHQLLERARLRVGPDLLPVRREKK